VRTRQGPGCWRNSTWSFDAANQPDPHYQLLIFFILPSTHFHVPEMPAAVCPLSR
jgi:hypothetical protein